MECIFKSVIESIPAPLCDESLPFKLLVSTISYSPFMGRLAIGKVAQGSLAINQEVVISSEESLSEKMRVFNFIYMV